jgi:hypothetical protein
MLEAHLIQVVEPTRGPHRLATYLTAATEDLHF